MKKENQKEKEKEKKTEPTAKDKVDLFPVFRTVYDLVLEFEHAHAQFPKIHKYSVGKKLAIGLLSCLEHVTTAVVAQERRIEALVDAIVELEKTRILIRLSHDLRAIDTKRYERFSRLIVQALMQVTGLLKVARKQNGVGSSSSRVNESGEKTQPATS